MKTLFFAIVAILLSLFLVFLFVSIKSEAIQEGNAIQEEYVPNEVLVKFREDVSRYIIKEEIISLQGKIITYLGKEIGPIVWDPADLSVRSFRLDPYLIHIRVPEAIGTEKATCILNQSPNVEYAEKNGIYHVCETIPDDPLRYAQYGLSQIQAYKAWDYTTGSSNIVVAMIDTGINLNHEDLKDYGSNARIWINDDEIAENRIDDDNNGYVDDVRSWNFVNNNNNIWDDDLQLHGTHVAGIVGAWTNNNMGIAAINWGVKIMVVKGLDSNASIKNSSVVNAIDYATENGAHISSNSYAKELEQKSTLGAIARAMNAGRLFIAAAGNKSQLDWRDNDIKSVYPSSHDHDNIISVAYTHYHGYLDEDSHYGFYSVDLAAPGRDILSTHKTSGEEYPDKYITMSGSSQAAPFVAGVAALVWGYRPSLNWWQVKTIILKNVDKIDSLLGKVSSEGRLNAYNPLSGRNKQENDISH